MPLNLDEFFGEARAVKVVWQGKDYELLRMEAFGPKQILRIEKLQKQAQKLRLLGDDVSDETAMELENTIDNLLVILCKDLPVKDMPFLAKMKTAGFYEQETRPKNAQGAARKKQTGRKSSAA